MLEPSLLLKKLADYLLLPPGGPIMLILLGLLLSRWQRRFGQSLAWLGVVLAFVLSTRVAGYALSTLLETDDIQAVTPAQMRALMATAQAPQAVVILTGGGEFDWRDSPEPDRASSSSLIRAVHGARLARWTGLPILVTGGTLYRGYVAEATTLARIIETDVRQPVKWVEAESLDTGENASRTASLLRPIGIERIVLVTQAWHMKRSLMLFREAGFQVTPAPVGFSGIKGGVWGTSLLPSIDGLTLSQRASHELMGIVWYQIRTSILPKTGH